MKMTTYRPDYMSQSNIDVFQSPRTSSISIFSIRVGQEVNVIQDRIRAIDPETGTFYTTPIFLSLIEWDGKTGYINRRWLK